jgi:hypothetical protein
MDYQAAVLTTVSNGAQDRQAAELKTAKQQSRRPPSSRAEDSQATGLKTAK